MLLTSWEEQHKDEIRRVQVQKSRDSLTRDPQPLSLSLGAALPGLLLAQFLGALNDNFFKIVLSMLAVHAVGNTQSGGMLSLIGAIFILPFLLFSGYAGHTADVYSKRTVLVVTKVLEIATMGLGVFALISGHFTFMLTVLFLLALQATFFSPAKYGILPELVHPKDLSRANGLLEMSSFLAIILGTSLGSILFAAWKDQLAWIGLVTLLLAVAGALASLHVPYVPPAKAPKSLGWNPLGEINLGLKRLYETTLLWRIVMGISYFWFLGALMQMDIILFGKEVMSLDDLRIGLLNAFLAIGIGVGSVTAGYLSGEKVELRLTPLGSLGMGLFSLLLAWSTFSYALIALALTLLGFSGGLFIVPLNASLQQQSGQEEKGRLLATNNFLNTIGILSASGVLWLLHDHLHMRADHIIGIFGVCTLAATGFIVRTGQQKGKTREQQQMRHSPER